MKKCRDLKINNYLELKKKTYKITNFSLNYLISSKNLFRALKNKEIDFGIFTIKNVQVGIVIESIEALAKYRCQIVDMF